MTSVARFLTFLHKLEIFPRAFGPKIYRHQILLHSYQNQQRFLCSFCVVIPRLEYSTSKALSKKPDLANKDEKAPKKKAPPIPKDEKTVQVFDESGLFVGKQKFWKAKADAAKKNLRLLEMNGSARSKKKVKTETDDESESTEILSYKLVSVDKFMENLNEVKTQKAKVSKLSQIVIKSNVDKGGMDIKVNQIKDILMKKGKLKIVIQSTSNNGVSITTVDQKWRVFCDTCI